MTARAIVLAAGKGTRMKSARPKVLHELCGRPMLWWSLQALRDAGIGEILVVANEELEPLLAPFEVKTVVQPRQLGTGDAVRVALAALAPSAGTILVAYGDMPLVERSLFGAVRDAARGNALALVTARMPLPSSFGRVLRDGDRVAKIVEAKDCSPDELAVDEMNAGIYGFDEPALRDAIARIGNDNAQGEYYLTDTVELLVAGGKRVVPVTAADHRTVLGVNDRVELADARAILNRRLCERYLREGVTIVDPATTYVEPELEIGADTVILPGTIVGGRSRIGARCRIGPHTRLMRSQLGDDVEICESVILDSHLGDRVSIGPYAHLRKGNVLGAEVHIGNFVELKSATLGEGVKSGHLSYVGDAEVGDRTNIGAGTITCNFDGMKKNRTTIGKDVFVGTNSSLVAPITLGDGALTGAGSVVIRDVPPGERVAGNPARPLAKKPAET